MERGKDGGQERGGKGKDECGRKKDGGASGKEERGATRKEKVNGGGAEEGRRVGDVRRVTLCSGLAWS